MIGWLIAWGVMMLVFGITAIVEGSPRLSEWVERQVERICR